MYTSFYTAAQGAVEQQKRMDVVANNMANVNNYGYKSKNATFLELMHYNLNNAHGEETTLKAGTGVVMMKTNTDFSETGFIETDHEHDYAIMGKGFFKLQNPDNGKITYSRNGRFSLSQRGDGFYLVNDNGNFVLDRNSAPIRVMNNQLSGEIGVYRFNILDGMLSIGDNEYVPTDKNGDSILTTDVQVKNHALEASNVDVAEEMSRIIESQRAYAYSLRMVQTSDEIVATINGLRQ